MNLGGLDIALPSTEGAAIDWERVVARFTSLQELAGVPQDPLHHGEGDVWVHTRMVATALTEMPVWQRLPIEEQVVTLAAALYHDVAKPLTTRCEDDGRITARGHARKGEVMARVELWRMGVPFKAREAVASMVRYHQHPFFLLGREDALRTALSISQTVRCDHLSLLAESDIRGRICEDQKGILEAVSMFHDYCQELECLAVPREFPNDLSRYEYFSREGRDPNYMAFDPGMFEVVLMCGLPASGKDHWVRTHRPDWPVIGLDDLRVEMDVDPGGNQGSVIQRALEDAKSYLRVKQSSIWNATNLTRQRREPLVALFSRYGAKVTIVHVEASAKTMMAANRARPETSRVPDRVIESMTHQWELPDPTEAHKVEYVVRE